MAEPPRTPRVTVVMIFLDAHTYIAEAIDSVLAQTYREFELVLVDDGSTDGSTGIAKQCASRHPGLVHYTEHEGHRNLGMSASRNHGVAVGRGPLVSFLDADDVWLPNRLERFVSEIDRFPNAAMLYGPTLYWYSWVDTRHPGSRGPDKQDFPGLLQLSEHTLIAPPGPLRKWLETEGSCVPGICSVMIRREAYEAVRGFEPEFRGLYEDQVFLSKMAATFPVVVIPDVLDYYRQHPDSACHRSLDAGEYDPLGLHPARHRYLRWLEGYCRDHALDDPALLRALRREMWPYQSRLNGLVYNTRRKAPVWFKRLMRTYLPLPVQTTLLGLRNRVWSQRGSKTPSG